MTDAFTPRDDRPRYKLTAPDEVRLFPKDPKVFVFVPLTAQQEIDAINTAERTRGVPGLELVRRAVESVDGQLVDWEKGGDRWLDQCSPKLRTALLGMYGRLFEPSAKDATDFFGSLEVLG